MKAFRMDDGRINIFRIEKHYDRFVKSLERMCMAVVPKEIFMEGLMKLVETDKQWVPAKTNDALYLRPFVIATEARFGVKVSSEYRFVIFTGPVSNVYAQPIKVKVETEYIRAARGGTGSAKCGGNYGGAFFPTQLARKEGYEQVLWTDARDNKYIEESGMMNVMFVIDDVLITPPLSDSILDGITRESLLILAKGLGYKTEERVVSIDELEKAFRNGSITEAFGAGTAAVVAPIKTIQINGLDLHLPAYTGESVLYRLKQKLEMIRTGKTEDVYNWNCIV
jgi:branched-chain amino acid aminotransferase